MLLSLIQKQYFSRNLHLEINLYAGYLQQRKPTRYSKEQDIELSILRDSLSSFDESVKKALIIYLQVFNFRIRVKHLKEAIDCY